jgi:hypothetical protein
LASASRAAACADRHRFDQDVEGAELHLVLVLAAVQGIEVKDAVDAEDHRLTIEDQPLLPSLARGLDNPRIAVGPIVGARRDQANAVTVALQPEAAAVVLDLVGPVRVGGDAGAFGGNAEVERYGVQLRKFELEMRIRLLNSLLRMRERAACWRLGLSDSRCPPLSDHFSTGPQSPPVLGVVL